jgi:hypothetical protein
MYYNGETYYVLLSCVLFYFNITIAHSVFKSWIRPWLPSYIMYENLLKQ